ncbi:hypothetical protein I3760_03G238900 [Carya illinoinensis]|nr:hypothetical protein I3760_03G238900 [Carya illinoinensis]KAG2718830.1 hypothetical protein I3760_03G238900 [Carya illinoinensis]KAG2718831.1 hypothetical protein I3760_03G238900 [Carya illinoinensis]KAG2718832.1 hypothetical protein I3760_03G238900 [Carya illinoinensis]KAG2718833.1 hypothetical protein I3760_03G238900 [Carya illinoinensis]
MATLDEEKLAKPDELKIGNSHEHTVETPDEVALGTLDEHTMGTSNEHTMETPNEHTMETPNNHTMGTPTEHTMKTPNNHTWETPNEHTTETISEQKVAPPDEQMVAPPDEQMVAPPDEQTMAPHDEQTMTPQDEQTMAPQDEQKMAPPDVHMIAPPDEHTMEVSDDHAMAISDEHALAISDEQALAISDEQALAISDEHALAISDEHALAISDEHALAISDEHALAISYEHTVPTPDNKRMTPEENHELPNSETQPNKRRKKKSIVWEHFTIETISPGCRRAQCKQCKQSFAYSTGSKVAGTSHLKRHIAKGTCTALLRSQGQNQSTPYTPRSRMGGTGSATDAPKRRYRTPGSPYIMFDQDRCRNEIARMIIMHDYPLHMVEHPGFIAFVQNLQPHFNMVSFNTIQGDCVATYLMEKQNLIKFIEGIPGRICLTLDMWTSSQTVGYVFITGHFIDSDWKLHRRVLNVIMEPYPDLDTALSHAVAACLSDWSLESKLFSLTFNQPLSEAALENLRSLLAIKNPLILNGQLLVCNCIAHTLSSMAKDVLGAGQGIIKKIRDSVKYVKTSEAHEEKFLDLKQQLQVPSERSLSLDDQTQWNTTYQMLVAASESKEVFSCLDTSDPDYKDAPSMEDWKHVETLCTYLKLLFDAANILTFTTNPAAITFFHELWKIHTELARAVASEDPFISNLSKMMQEKVEKYWKDSSLVLAIAVVMDPRFKMKLVEFSFSKVYGEEAPTYINIVNDGIHELFHEYLTLPLPLTPTYAEEGNGGSNIKMEDSQGGNLLSDHGLTDFDVYIMETTSQQMKSELDQYLEESLLPRVQEFDVLGWWKLNKMKYPTLSKMARDILSIPVSTAGPDAVFDITGKEMDRYRSSLRPETVEALICAKDWMQYGSTEASNALVRMEY